MQTLAPDQAGTALTYTQAKRKVFASITPRDGTIFEREHLIHEVETVVGARVYYNILSFGKKLRNELGRGHPRTRHISMSLRDYWRGIQTGEIKVM